MYKFINNQIPSIFSDLINKLFTVKFLLERHYLNSTKYSISICGPKLWNDVINKEGKDIQSYSLFQKKNQS